MTRPGIIGLLTIILISLLLVGTVGALEFRTVYNPFTRQLDYYRTGNFTGENVTASFFIGDGSLLTNLPSGADGVGFYVAQGPFLFNTSASTIQFNSTLLNNTITSIVGANQSFTNIAFRNESNNFTGQIIAPIVNGAHYVKSGNSTDFQHVINSCSSSQTAGCTIYVAPGVMNTTVPIVLSKDNLIIYAYGVNLQSALGNSSLLMTNLSAIRGTVIYGLNVTNRGSGRDGYGFNLSEFRDAQLFDVSADNFEVGIFIDKYYNILQKPIVRRANVGIKITGNTNKVIKSRVSGSTNFHYEIAGVANNLDSPNAETINNNTYGYVIRGFWNTVDNPYAEGLPGENGTAYWLPGTGIEVNNGYASNVNTSVLNTGRGNSYNPRFSRQRVIASAENTLRLVGSGFTGSGSIELSPQSVDGSPAYVDVFNNSNSNTNVFRLFNGTGNETVFVINNGQIVQGSFAPGLNLVRTNGSNTYTGAGDQHFGGADLRSVDLIQASNIQTGYNVTSNGTVNNWLNNWRGLRALAGSSFFFDNTGEGGWFIRNNGTTFISFRYNDIRVEGAGTTFRVDRAFEVNGSTNKTFIRNQVNLPQYSSCTLTTNSSGDIVCGSGAGNMSYTNLAFLNQSNTFVGNITADRITGVLNLSQKVNIIYVKDYMWNATPIQAALDAGGSNSIVYADQQTYNVTRTSYIYSNQDFRGFRTTLSAVAPFTGDTIIQGMSNTSDNYLSITDIAVDCNSIVENGYHFNFTKLSWMTDIGARECTQNNIWLEEDNYYFHIDGGNVVAAQKNGIRVDDNEVQIERLRMSGSGATMINVTKGNSIRIIGNEIDDGSAAVGIYLDDVDGVDIVGGRIEGPTECYVMGSKINGVRIFGSYLSGCDRDINYTNPENFTEVQWFGHNDDTQLGMASFNNNGNFSLGNFTIINNGNNIRLGNTNEPIISSPTTTWGNSSNFIQIVKSATTTKIQTNGTPLEIGSVTGLTYFDQSGSNNGFVIRDSNGNDWTLRSTAGNFTFQDEASLNDVLKLVGGTTSQGAQLNGFLMVNNTGGAQHGIVINQRGQLAAGVNALFVTSNQDHVNNNDIIKFEQTNSTTNVDLLRLLQRGPGKLIAAQCFGNSTTDPKTGGCINLDNSRNNASAVTIFSGNTGDVARPLISISTNNTSFDQDLISLNYSGTGRPLSIEVNGGTEAITVQNVASGSKVFNVSATGNIFATGLITSQGQRVLLANESVGGSGMDYTNLALINQTNIFAENQFFSKNITLTNGYFSLQNNDVVASSTALNLVYIEALNESFDRPIVRIIGHSTNGGEADIRIDSPNPDIELIESDQVSPDGKFEIAGQGDELQLNSRTSTDDSFDTFFKFKQKQDATSSTPLARLIFDSNNSLTSVLRLENEANSAGAATALDFYNTAGDVVSASIRSKSGVSHTAAILSFWTADATKTPIERINITNTGNVTVDILRGVGLGCVGVDAEGHLYRTGAACGSGGSMDYTNLALVNNTNNFTAYQQFSANTSVLDSAGNGLHLYSNNSITAVNWSIASNGGTAKLVLGGSRSMVLSVTEAAISLSTNGGLPFELKSATGLSYFDISALDNKLLIRDSAGNDMTLQSGGGMLKIVGENQGNIANFIDNATGKGFNVTGFITAQGLITSQGQRVLLANETVIGTMDYTNLALKNQSNTFTEINTFTNTTIMRGGAPSSSTPGATNTAWAIITNQNGSMGGHYQQNILTADGQTSYGAYYLANSGGGTVTSNRTIYGTQNEMYVGTDGASPSAYAQGYGMFNYAGQTGVFSRFFSSTNIVLNNARSSQSYATYDLVTCGEDQAQCVGNMNIVIGANSTINKTLSGAYITVSPDNLGDVAAGLTITTNATINLTNPTGRTDALYINWTSIGTDALNKKHAIYVEHTASGNGKSYFGDPVTFNGTGPGIIANTQANFNDLAVFNNLVGLYSTTYLFGAMQVIGANGGSITLNDATLSGTNTASVIPIAQFINTNSSAVSQMAFTSAGFPGGGQLNFFAGGSNAAGSYAQFNNRSVIQGDNLLDIAIENPTGHITMRATAASNQAQVNLTASDLWVRVNQTITNGHINLSTSGPGNGQWIGGCNTYWNGTDEIKAC